MDSGLAHDQWVGIAICELCFQSALSVSSSCKCCRQVFHSFCMHRCLPMLMHAYVWLCMLIHAYACLCICMHMHACACICICKCMHMQMHAFAFAIACTHTVRPRVRETLERDAALKAANKTKNCAKRKETPGTLDWARSSH